MPKAAAEGVPSKYEQFVNFNEDGCPSSSFQFVDFFEFKNCFEVATATTDILFVMSGSITFTVNPHKFYFCG